MIKKPQLAKLVALLFVSLAATTGQAHPNHPKKAPQPLLEQLKPLVGTWEATVDGEKVRTIYSVGSKGNTLIENLMPESESMLNVIHADGAALMMTHYCSKGSQPRYRATKIEGDRIVFKFVDGMNLGDSYMSGVTLTMPDRDHLTQEWINREKGKETIWRFDFVRTK